MLLLRVLGSRGLIYGSFKVVFHTFCDCVRHFGATLLGFIGKKKKSLTKQHRLRDESQTVYS